MRHRRRKLLSPWTACAVPYVISPPRADDVGTTIRSATQTLRNESVELSEKMRLALVAQRQLLDKRRALLEERRRQLSVVRSLIASSRSMITAEQRDNAAGSDG
jgi:hypothetical protein